MKVHEPKDLGFDCYSGCQISKQYLEWDEDNESYDDFWLQIKYFRNVKSEDREVVKGGVRLTVREKIADPTVFMPKKKTDGYMEKYMLDEQDEKMATKKKGKR